MTTRSFSSVLQHARRASSWAVFSLALAAAAPSACRPSGQRAYLPRVRDLTITAVPLLTRELARVYPFLVRDFAAGGVLEGKEVYGFSPSTLVAYEGDTL